MKVILNKLMGYYFAPLQFLLELSSFSLLLFGLPSHPYFKVFLPLCLHLIAIMLLAFGFLKKWDWTKINDKNYAVIGLLISFPVPLLGFIAFSILYLILEKGRKKQGVLLKEFEEYISYEPYVTPLRLYLPEGEKEILEEVELIPLKEIMEGDNVELKRGAILILSRIGRRQAIEILRKALTDEDREIRYYASHSLSEIEREYSEKIFNLKKEMEREGKTYEKTINYVTLCKEYVDSGILDPTMEEFFLDSALIENEEAIKLNPDVFEPYELKGKFLMKRKIFEKAINSFEKAIEKGDERFETFLNILNCFYELKKYEEAGGLLQKLKIKFPEKSKELKEMEVFFI